MAITINISRKNTQYTIDFYKKFSEIIHDNNAPLFQQINNRNCLFVTDENVFTKTDFFRQESIKNKNRVVLPAGEQNKTWKNIEKIVDACFEHNLDRSSILIAVGGGVIGDMTGFASSIFMRGIPFIQIPTTLLSMVDSSVGGKTGIDTAHGKNLIGSFHQPEAVLCCEQFLSTLECIEIQNGLSEMIKHGILGSEKHFNNLENLLKKNTHIFHSTDIHDKCDHSLLHEIFMHVSESIAIKQNIIEQDEKEQFGGVRGFLNLGHTYGHAIELLSNFTVPHGIGVAKGIMCAVKESKKRNILSHEQSIEKIEKIFAYANIDTQHHFSQEEIISAMVHDKKKKDGNIQLILIEKIGKVRYEYL